MIVLFRILIIASVMTLFAAPAFAERKETIVGPKRNLNFNPSKWKEITSSTLEASDSSRKIVYSGNVLAKGEFTLCTDELKFVYTESGVLVEVKAEGSVGVVHEGRAATGDSAFYDGEKSAIVISGNARAMQCGTEVFGDRITFYLKNDSVNVEGGSGRVRAIVMPGGKKCDTKKTSGESTVCAKPR